MVPKERQTQINYEQASVVDTEALSSQDITKSLEQQAQDLLKQIENQEGKSLAKQEYEEFRDKLQNNYQKLKVSNLLEKDLIKRLKGGALKEFKNDIKAIDNLENIAGATEFFDLLKTEFSEKQQEKVYKKFKRGVKKDYLLYLFGEEKLPSTKEDISKLLNLKPKKQKDKLFKQIDSFLNQDKNPIKVHDDIAGKKGTIEMYIEKLSKLKQIVSKDDISEIDIRQQELKTEQTELKTEQTELKTEQTKLKTEQTELEAEQTELEAEVQELKNNLKEKDEEIVNNQFKILKSFGDFESLRGFEDIKNLDKITDISEKKKVVDNFITFLEGGVTSENDGGNLKAFVVEAAQKGNREMYNKAISFVKTIGAGSSALMQRLQSIPDYDSIVKGTYILKEGSNLKSATIALGSLQADDISDVTKNGNTYTYKDRQVVLGDDGEVTTFSINPQTGYKLETQNADFGDDYKKVDEFKEKIGFVKEKFKETGTDLNDLLLQKQQLEEKIKAGVEVENGKDLKQELQQLELKIKEKKLYLDTLVEKAKQTEKEYKEFMENAQLKIDEEKQEKQREVLDFLHKTGFDLLPQSITDQLINEYKFNIFDINGLDLNPERLDLANGMFGENPTEADGTKWKQNLVMFLNKLIYGETNPTDSPLNPDAFIGVMGAAINPTELQAIFENKGIKTGYTWNIDEMRKNLKKEKSID